MSEFILHVLIISSIYGVLALSLNLQAGFAGLMNFGQVAFFGCGTYAVALAVKYDLGLIAGFGIAIGSAIAIAYAFASIGKNLQADYWGIVTLALAETIRIVLTNEEWLTGGAQGISGIPSLYPHADQSVQQILVAVTCLALLFISYLSFRWFTTGRYGLGLKIMREEPQLAQSLGYNTLRLKRQCMVISALFAAAAGIIYAKYTSFVSPDQLLSADTFIIWAMVIIGGQGNHLGALVGAFLLQLLFALIPFVKDALGLPTEFVAAIRLAVTGIGLICFILWKKSGIVPEKVGGTRLA
ncbi:branched-chain amino acid ABC transporter permease [Pseudomonas chlororaphis]|uniref:branched-chain amino acid ABC transporter permease n=1 Tax=Pseudomonas chlororaphis TaxID=587753 RepID=UPI0024087FCB|nr:branched-chain amino acid ABC transporter permease [Pseudomonas chlororaphis]